MDRGTLGLIIQEGSKIVGEVIRNRVLFFNPAEPQSKTEIPPAQKQTKKEGVATGCIPCSIGHLGTCSGLLNEAMRFARKDGMSDEVISRVNMCVDELNALERVDLRPEIIHPLPDWEKAIADKALNLSRTLRHDLEQLTTVDGLEGLAAKTQGGRQEIGTTWWRERLKRMSPEQRKVLEERLSEKTAAQKEANTSA
jgi:hypothetical protein